MLIGVHPLGPYFEVDRHDIGVEPVAPWRSMAELLDADVLTDRVEQVRAALAFAGQCALDDVPPRVAASVMHLGLVARLISPVLADVTLEGRQISVSLADWWWQPQVGATFPMSLPVAGELVATDAGAPAAAGEMVDGPVTQLSALVGDRFSLSARVLWGNVASALNAARGLIGTAVPAAAGRVDLIANVIRQRPGLAEENGRFGPDFRRRSCCLIYQLAPDSGEAVCGDCVLRKRRDDAERG
jgi:FhuF 2Fe-2S C-terminal domain